MPIGVRYGIPMETFYRLNPKKIQRYQPYMLEWLSKHKEGYSEVGWVNGLYVQQAVASMMSKKVRYPSEPMKLYGSDEPMTEEEAEAQAYNDAERFAAFAAMFNKSHEKQFADKDKENTTSDGEGATSGRESTTSDGDTDLLVPQPNPQLNPQPDTQPLSPNHEQ